MLKIPKEIFRAYDIRGIVDSTLTPEIVFEIARALAFTILEAGETKLVVGRDGRLSGPTLVKALKEGILSTGCDVVDIGAVPTPLLYYATHHLKIPSGVMLTGSHNPPNYNGLKMVAGGKALYGEGIQELYQRVLRAVDLKSHEKEKVHGKEKNHGKKKDHEKEKKHGKEVAQSIQENYMEEVLSTIQLKRSLKPLKVVVDCGNGIASVIAPLLYERLGVEVIPLFCTVDGHFPNHHPDPSQPKNLQDLIAAVRQHKADLGVAFDGDGDRLGVVDNQGKIIWPDRLLILFAEHLLKKNKEALVLYDVKCSRHVEKEITKFNGQSLMWKTGHSYIKAKMKETGALLAGEMSGHLFFQDRWFGFDDGIYAGARLLEIVAEDQVEETRDSLFDRLPDSVVTPEIVIAVLEEDKSRIVEGLVKEAYFENAKISTIDGLRVDFSDGFGLIRPSNTGPNLVLRFEGDSQDSLKRIQSDFQILLSRIVPGLMIPV